MTRYMGSSFLITSLIIYACHLSVVTEGDPGELAELGQFDVPVKWIAVLEPGDEAPGGCLPPELRIVICLNSPTAMPEPQVVVPAARVPRIPLGRARRARLHHPHQDHRGIHTSIHSPSALRSANRYRSRALGDDTCAGACRSTSIARRIASANWPWASGCGRITVAPSRTARGTRKSNSLGSLTRPDLLLKYADEALHRPVERDPVMR